MSIWHPLLVWEPNNWSLRALNCSEAGARHQWTNEMEEELWGLKMLLLRRNTTSLTKFHPLTLHTSPNYSELTKHRTCEATIVKKSIYRNQGRKSKPDFCWILFVMPEDVSIGGKESVLNIKDAMYWRNFNPFWNIWDVVELESYL
jgi:hypothetical protein